MVEFDLGNLFDGAICPVNTLAHLTQKQMKLHLQSMARHLKKGARYLTQVALRDPDQTNLCNNALDWEASRGETRLRMSVSIVNFDPTLSREQQHFHIEVLSGPRAGEVHDESHWMTSWTPESWLKEIGDSAFIQTAQYDGDLLERPKVKIGQPGNLMWQELMRR